MMTKSLAKVQKKLSKKGTNINSLHENSRNSQRLRRASARGDKLQRVSTARAKVNKPYLQRVAYFQGVAKATRTAEPISVEQIHHLIQSLIERDNEELEKLQSERRSGRPTSTREDLLKQRIAMEEREYEGGFWIPDMMNAQNVKLLTEWSGLWTALSTLTYIRLERNGTTHESIFPPKGQS